MEFLIDDTLGSELLSWINAVSKSVGMVILDRASRLETLNCGALIFPRGLILLISLTTLVIAELREVASFFKPETMVFTELCTNEVI